MGVVEEGIEMSNSLHIVEDIVIAEHFIEHDILQSITKCNDITVSDEDDNEEVIKKPSK